MAMMCRTADGDVLDVICHDHYAHLNGSVEAVLEANYGLADEPQPFRAGLIITLPDLPAQDGPTLRLWS